MGRKNQLVNNYMFEHNEISPFDELIKLKQESLAQQNIISNLIANSQKIHSLLIELSDQHQKILSQYNSFDLRLMKVELHLSALKEAIKEPNKDS